jgi:hypothetical protein
VPARPHELGARGARPQRRPPQHPAYGLTPRHWPAAPAPGMARGGAGLTGRAPPAVTAPPRRPGPRRPRAGRGRP